MSFVLHFVVGIVVLSFLFQIVDERYMNKVGLLNNETHKINNVLISERSVEIQRQLDEVFQDISADTAEFSDIESTVLCPPFDSCIGRCGTTNNVSDYTCNCDTACIFYKDCCVDYEKLCHPEHTDNKDPHRQQPFTRASPRCWHYSLYHPPFSLISQCSPDWFNLDLELDSLFSEKACNITAYDDSSSKFSACLGKCDIFCRLKLLEDCEGSQNVNSLVQDSEGYIYSRGACAMCNGQSHYSEIGEIHLNYTQNGPNANEANYNNYRPCYKSIFTCLYNTVYMGNQNLSILCQRYSGPVLGQQTIGANRTRALYKNVYCALCNGEDYNLLSCPLYTSLGSFIDFQNFQNSMSYAWEPITETDEGTFGIQGRRFDDLPVAFSILLNFGLDGRRRMMISSEGSEEEMRHHQKLCGQHHIWDPFSKVCRKLFCSKEFDLVDFRCVKREEQKHDNDSWTQGNASVIDIGSDFVHLSLSVEMELLDLLKFYGQEHNFTEIVASSMSEAFHINIDRIRNVKINITLGNITDYNATMTVFDVMDDPQTIVFTINFDLYEPSKEFKVSEPSVDSIVSMIASSLSVDGFDLTIDNIRSRIFEIHQTMDSLSSWCSPSSGGVQKEYWNSDFTLIMNNEVSLLQEDLVAEVYINKTDKSYYKGQFVANILFQGYRLSDNMINISGLVIVCEMETKLDASCTRIMLESHEYIFLENGSLRILNFSENSYVPNTTVYEIGENNSIFVCLYPKNQSKYVDYYLQLDITQAYVSLILLCISVFALTIVFVTYVVFPSLRNLPGCNTMNLTVSLLAMQVTFILGQRDAVTGGWCKFVAMLLHYEILCSFMWMNVMAYDLYKTFGNNSVLKIIRSKRKFLIRYMLYAYGGPAIIIVICVLLENFNSGLNVAPHYGGDDVCWITSQKAAFTFFALPLALVMLVNFGFYTLTIKAVRDVKTTVHLTANDHSKPGWKDVVLYARMALVTGLTWTLAFIAAYVNCDQMIGQIVTYLFIIFNTLQGLFLLFVFVYNKRVLSLYSSSFKKVFNSKRLEASTTSGILQRLARGMNRSVSTETTLSTISSISSQSGKYESSTVYKKVIIR